MKFLLLFSTILLTLTQNNLFVDACVPVYELLADVNVNSRLPLEFTLKKFNADAITKEGFYQLQKCFSTLTPTEKLRHLSIETNIAASPQCINN